MRTFAALNEGASPDYSRVRVIEKRDLQSVAMNLCPWSGRQTEVLKRTPEKKGERRAEHQRRD